jgi:hypothetical protein
MTIDVKVWKDLPDELQPLDHELASDWRARVAAYDVAHPGALTFIDAVGLMDLEERMGGYTDEQVADEATTRQTADDDEATARAAAIAAEAAARAAAITAAVADRALVDDLLNEIDSRIAGDALAEQLVHKGARGGYMAFEGVTVLPLPSGGNDAPAINALLANGGAYRGVAGETYKISEPFVLWSHSRLDMRGCNVELLPGAKCNLFQTKAAAPVATANDATTAVGSNVVASPTLAAQAQVGQMLGVRGAGPLGGDNTRRIDLYGKITNVAGNNITLDGNLNGVAASVALSGATAFLYNRDSKIELVGGRWDAKDNWNLLADRATIDAHLLRLRRCDGLTVRDLTVAQTGFPAGGGWCFGVAPGDCTDFIIDNITADGASTAVQPEGPLSGGIISNIRGNSQDDLVALGTVGAGGTTGTTTDLEGDITDVLVKNVQAKNAWSVFKIFAAKGANGQYRPVFNVTATGLKGTTQNWAVQVLDYGDPAGTNASAWVDNILLEDVSVIPGSFTGTLRPMIYLNASAAHLVKCHDISWPANAPPATGGVIATGYGVQTLRVRNLNVSGNGAGYIGVLLGTNTNAYQLVDIDDVNVPDAAVTCDVVKLSAAATGLDRLVVRNVKQKGPGGIVNNQGRPVTDIVLSKVQQSNAATSLYASLVVHQRHDHPGRQLPLHRRRRWKRNRRSSPGDNLPGQLGVQSWRGRREGVRGQRHSSTRHGRRGAQYRRWPLRHARRRAGDQRRRAAGHGRRQHVHPD